MFTTTISQTLSSPPILQINLQSSFRQQLSSILQLFENPQLFPESVREAVETIHDLSDTSDALDGLGLLLIEILYPLLTEEESEEKQRDYLAIEDAIKALIKNQGQEPDAFIESLLTASEEMEELGALIAQIDRVFEEAILQFSDEMHFCDQKLREQCQSIQICLLQLNQGLGTKEDLLFNRIEEINQSIEQLFIDMQDACIKTQSLTKRLQETQKAINSSLKNLFQQVEKW